MNQSNATLPTQESIFHTAEPPKDTAVEPDTLRATINIFEESIFVYRYDRHYTCAKNVSADDLARAFTQHASFPSGLLPKNTLWTKHTPTGLVVAIFREAQIWQAALQTDPFSPPERFELPMPPLVFIHNAGKSPWVFAAKKRPTSPAEDLYHSPTFNTFSDGRVCPGTHKFPDSTGEIPESFFLSYFSMTGNTQGRSANHPDSLLDLWREINQKEQYPLEDLIPFSTVRAAMEIPKGRF